MLNTANIRRLSPNW